MRIPVIRGRAAQVAARPFVAPPAAPPQSLLTEPGFLELGSVIALTSGIQGLGEEMAPAPYNKIPD